jgi:glycosyltransferase involved in cell wall biosynthesis
VRLVLACHSYYPAVGGVERFAQGLAEGLVRRGVDVTVVTRRDPGTLSREDREGVTILRLSMARVGRFHFPRGYWSTLRRLRPEVFHLSGNRVWCADFYLPFAGRREWPQVMTGHGFYQYEMHARRWDRWYFEKYLPGRIRQFDVYTAHTVHERDQLVGWGVDPARIELVPAGIPLAEFDAPRTERSAVRARWRLTTPQVAVYAGGFYENKRVDRLVRAIAATRGRWGLVAFGRDLPGSAFDRERITRLATELRAPVALAGVLPRSETLDALGAADAVVLGSSYEGFGLLMLEAMAMGRPFVAYRTGAAPELAATGSGFCVDSQEEFVEGLGRLEDPTLRERMGAKGRETVGAYSVENQVGRFLGLYQRLSTVRR